jgi:hypothetical protein
MFEIAKYLALQKSFINKTIIEGCSFFREKCKELNFLFAQGILRVYNSIGI